MSEGDTGSEDQAPYFMCFEPPGGFRNVFRRPDAAKDGYTPDHGPDEPAMPPPGRAGPSSGPGGMGDVSKESDELRILANVARNRRSLITRVGTMADAQRRQAWELREAVLAARAAGATWEELAAEAGISYPSLLRQVKAGSPVVVARPFHKLP